MWHIVTTFWFSVCVFCWLMTCALSIFSALDNFCQISPLHGNEVWITRVLHLICNAHTHTHTLLFGSKFHIILAMYVQMLDIYKKYRKYRKNRIFSIFSKISRYFPTLIRIRQTRGHWWAMFEFRVPHSQRYLVLINQSINQSFICSEQHKKQVNAQYNVEQDTKAWST